MKKGTKKSPIQPRSKEQILADMRKNEHFIKRMKFVKEKFYPALIEASQNIQDASFLLEGFNTTIMQEFLGRMKTVLVKDLALMDKLDKESPKYAENLAMLQLFMDKNVFEAKELIEGMKNEIETFKMDELKDRPLSSLKTKWIDEI